LTHRLHCAAALCVVAIAAPAKAQSRLAKPLIDTLPHHIVRVMNPGPTSWPDTNGWKLVYERTVQPKDGEPGEFADPAAVVLLNDGRLIETETRPAVIQLYDVFGHFVRTIGRTGDGPGEFRNPNPMLFRDTLVIHDPQLHRGTLYTLDGKVVRSFATACCSFGAPYWIDARGRMVVQGLGKTVGGQWIIIDINGRRLDSLPPPLAAPPHTWTVLNSSGMPSATVTIPFAGRTLRTILGNGSVLYGATDAYQLVVSATGRDTVRIFGRTGVKPVPVRQALRDSTFRVVLDRVENLRSVAHEADMPTTYPLWTDISQDGAGNIWIERAASPASRREFDVFSLDGWFLGTVPAPFAGGRVGAWSRDHLALLDTDDNDLPRIRIFRVDRRGH
jgi:hypothetical protein